MHQHERGACPTASTQIAGVSQQGRLWRSPSTGAGDYPASRRLGIRAAGTLAPRTPRHFRKQATCSCNPGFPPPKSGLSSFLKALVSPEIEPNTSMYTLHRRTAPKCTEPYDIWPKHLTMSLNACCGIVLERVPALLGGMAETRERVPLDSSARPRAMSRPASPHVAGLTAAQLKKWLRKALGC